MCGLDELLTSTENFMPMASLEIYLPWQGKVNWSWALTLRQRLKHKCWYRRRRCQNQNQILETKGHITDETRTDKLDYTSFVLFNCCIRILGSFVQNKQVGFSYCDEFTIKAVLHWCHWCGIHGQCSVTSRVAEITLMTLRFIDYLQPLYKLYAVWYKGSTKCRGWK